MSRRRRSDEVAISLFPFLSILACVIGVLTLVIMSLSLSQITQGRENEDVARAEEGASVRKRIEELRAQIEELGKDKQVAVKKIKLESEVAALKEKVVVPPEDDQVVQEKIAKADRMIAAQKLAIRELEKKQKERENKLAEFEELKKKPKVLIQPSGGNSKIRPQFVEVRKDAVVIHAISKSIPVKFAELAKNADYKKLVDYVKDGEERGRTIVFLIRQDALGQYARARDIALAGGANVAKLPLLGEGPVDLAAFGIKRK